MCVYRDQFTSLFKNLEKLNNQIVTEDLYMFGEKVVGIHYSVTNERIEVHLLHMPDSFEKTYEKRDSDLYPYEVYTIIDGIKYFSIEDKIEEKVS